MADLPMNINTIIAKIISTKNILLKGKFFFLVMQTVGLKEFDCKNKTHVKWLKEFTDVLNEMGSTGDMVRHGQKIRMILGNNPMGVDIKPEAFIDTHAGISIKYAGNVLNGTAWVPKC